MLGAAGKAISAGLEAKSLLEEKLGSDANGSISMERDLILKSLGDERTLVKEIQAGLKSNDFHPDTTGYVAFILVPPDLSGYGKPVTGSLGGDQLGGTDDEPNSYIVSACRRIPLLSLEFTPPDTSINVSEISNNAGIKVPYSSGKESGGQMTVNYIEDRKLTVHTLHNVWMNYIDDVTRGYIDPADKYIDGNEAFSIDYVTSAFIIKYNPTFDGEIYIGKATGIFPTNVTSKELLGTRSESQLTMLNVTYICAEYIEVPIATSSHMDQLSHHYYPAINDYNIILNGWYNQKGFLNELLGDVFNSVKDSLTSTAQNLASSAGSALSSINPFSGGNNDSGESGGDQSGGGQTAASTLNPFDGG